LNRGGLQVRRWQAVGESLAASCKLPVLTQSWCKPDSSHGSLVWPALNSTGNGGVESWLQSAPESRPALRVTCLACVVSEARPSHGEARPSLLPLQRCCSCCATRGGGALRVGSPFSTSLFKSNPSLGPFFVQVPTLTLVSRGGRCVCFVLLHVRVRPAPCPWQDSLWQFRLTRFLRTGLPCSRRQAFRGALAPEFTLFIDELLAIRCRQHNSW
jgi:hypothetical protein